MERVLQEVLHSPAHRGFAFLIYYKSLVDDLKRYEDQPKYQRLVIEFEKGEDPDDAYSQVPYEKGANFLLYLGSSSTFHLKALSKSRFPSQNARWVDWMSSYLISMTMPALSKIGASPPPSGKIICMNTSERMVGRRKYKHLTPLIGM